MLVLVLLGAAFMAVPLALRKAPLELRPCQLLSNPEATRLTGAPMKPQAAGGGVTCVFSLDPPRTVVSFIHATPPYVIVATRELETPSRTHRDVLLNQAKQNGSEVAAVDIGDEAVLIRDDRFTKRRILQTYAGEWYVEVEVGHADSRPDLEPLLLTTVAGALRRAGL